MNPPSSPTAMARPDIFYVTDRRALAGASPAAVLEGIRRAIVAQADFVQIREKDLPANELLNITTEAMRLAAEIAAPTRILVNDRLDVALTAGAFGVHLGQPSLPAPEVLEWCRARARPDFLVGVSCHSVEETRAAETAGAHYVFFGPVFDTPSKRLFGPPQGLERLEAACRSVQLKVIAVGGVNELNAADCMKAGASGIAAIRLFQDTRQANALASTLFTIHQIPLKAPTVRRSATDPPAASVRRGRRLL
jgi:thiamine-phosphate pyrophosphorylase